MKFIYEYRTSDNVKHSGVVDALDREAAFATLKACGIKPGFMREAPGFFNKLFGKGKRWLAIAFLLLALISMVVLLLSETQKNNIPFADSIYSSVRRQLLGDTAVIEKGIRTGWADVFSTEGDRFLASFAIPGVPAGVRTTTEAELKRALEKDSVVRKSAGLEARQIVAIVNGIKGELREHLKSGWTIREAANALVKRQEREIGFYRLALNEVERAKQQELSEDELLTLWEKKNDELRRMGIKLIPLPE